MNIVNSPNLSRCWKIRFIGESVDDCGGGYSDSIAEICEELQNMNPDDQIPVLIPSPCTADFEEKSSIEFIFRPMKENEIDSNMSLLFEFIGLLIGAAIRQGSPLSLRYVFKLMLHSDWIKQLVQQDSRLKTFERIDESMWKLLKGQKLELKDLYRLDNALENKFEFIRTAENDELDVLELEGSINSFTGEKIQIINGNITKDNRKKYLYLAKEYKQNEFNEIIELIRFGISKVNCTRTPSSENDHWMNQKILDTFQVIPLPLLSLFSSKVLGKLITGEVDIPIGLLKKVTVYKGITVDSGMVQDNHKSNQPKCASENF